MPNVLVQESSLQDIADAIRSKNGTQDTYKPAEMADAIEAISGGGITPTGTKSITENGTYDVTAFASAQVDVPTVTPTGTKQISITQNGTTTEDVTNYANAEITVDVSGGSGRDYLAEICEGTITRLDDENITNMSISLFRGYTKSSLTVFLENCKTLSGGYCFGGSGVKNVVLPALEKVTSAGYFFSGAGTIKLDIGENFSTESVGIRNNSFNGATAMNVLILRKTSAIVPLQNINAFTNTPFASGKAGGTLFVPSSLVSSYQSDTNWSTILGYADNSIQAIEGSVYESAYADGTAII